MIPEEFCLERQNSKKWQDYHIAYEGQQSLRVYHQRQREVYKFSMHINIYTQVQKWSFIIVSTIFTAILTVELINFTVKVFYCNYKDGYSLFKTTIFGNLCNKLFLTFQL